jgi:hypothetical protein
MTLTGGSRDSDISRFSRIPPKRKIPAVSIILDCTDSASTEIYPIISDLLDSTFYDFRAYLTNCVDFDAELVEILREDDRFHLGRLWPGFDDGSEFVVYIPAKYRLIRYSLEAIIESLASRSANVLRILPSRKTTGVEAWRSEFVRNSRSVQAAERIARKSRTEWWVSADSLGIWAEGAAVPKPFVRRGSAGEHVLLVRVHDSRSDAVKYRRRNEVSGPLRLWAGRLMRALPVSLAGTTTRSGRPRTAK